MYSIFSYYNQFYIRLLRELFNIGKIIYIYVIYIMNTNTKHRNRTNKRIKKSKRGIMKGG